MIQKQKLPLVSKEFLNALMNHFQPIEVKPGLQRDEIMFNAGQMSVVKFIAHHVQQGFVIGDTKNL